jgi:hypothetical protein
MKREKKTLRGAHNNSRLNIARRMIEMTAGETNRKKDKTKSEGSDPRGAGMSDMMEKCCSGEGAFADCSTMMKGMIKTMRSKSCCAPKTKDTGPEKGKNIKSTL